MEVRRLCATFPVNSEFVWPRPNTDRAEDPAIFVGLGTSSIRGFRNRRLYRCASGAENVIEFGSECRADVSEQF